MNDSDLDDTLQLESFEKSDDDISEGQSEKLTPNLRNELRRR